MSPRGLFDGIRDCEAKETQKEKVALNYYYKQYALTVLQILKESIKRTDIQQIGLVPRM